MSARTYRAVLLGYAAYTIAVALLMVAQVIA